MVRAVSPAEAGAPGGGSENHYGQKEKDASNFKPEDSTDALEWAQKTADPTRDATSGLTGDLPGGAAGDLALAGTGASSRHRPAGGSLGAGSYALAGNTSRDAETDANGAANGLRLHFDLMVTAWLPERFRWQG